MAKKIVKLQNTSIKIAMFVFAIILLGFALASFGLFDITDQNKMIMTVAAAVIIFTEVGFVKSMLRGKMPKTDIFGLLGIIAGLVVIITLVLDLLGGGLAFLDSIRGFVFVVIAVSFFIETFAR